MTFWSDKTAVVTGANGFAGSNLCRSLVEHGARVVAVVTDRSRSFNLSGLEGVDVAVGDVNRTESMVPVFKGADVVFHAAAKVEIEKTRKFPRETLETNAIGTFNVASAAKECGVPRIVHVSTCHIYGNQPEASLPIREDAVPNPHDVYAVSKVMSELVLRPFMLDGMDVVVTRAFNHYGPAQTGDFFVARTISQLLRGEVPHLGNPTPTRDYSYVGDIADGYVACAEKGRKGEVYHLSSGRETSIGEMFEKIRDACGAGDVDAVWKDSRKQDMSRSFGDSSKARRELGWKPKVSLEDGLEMTVEWWRRHPALWRKIR